MKKPLKKLEIITVIVLIIFIIAVLTAVYLWKESRSYVYGPRPPYKVECKLTETDDGWELLITGTNMRITEDDISYYLKSEKGEILEKGKLSTINGNSSLEYNITWYSTGRIRILDAGDIIFISKTGGTKGKAYEGCTFSLFCDLDDEKALEIVLK